MSQNQFARHVSLAAIVALVLAACGCREEGEGTSAAPTTSSPASGSAPSGETVPAEAMAARQPFDAANGGRLAGWWLRHDQGYMPVVDAVGDDGRLSARYLNPQPVNISKAEAWSEASEIRLIVELTDRNYPGSFYELAYRQDDDMLVGVYHNLQVGQDLDVLFTRFEPDNAAPR